MEAITYKGQKVITTELLAQAYETTTDRIKQNFNRNKERFEEKKHYFLLTSEELKSFKREVSFSALAVPANVNTLYLWTERGANRHSKILDTDKAWEQFENLEETYFRVKEAGAFQLGSLSVDGVGAIASLLREERLILTAQKSSGSKIARQAELTLKAFGLPVISDFVAPAYEQAALKPFAGEPQPALFGRNV